jgi:energy-coupling factor transporter ATP-binding protein EcfA2
MPESQSERRKATVILVTHEPYIAAMAERIVTFEDGRIVGDVSSGMRRAWPGGPCTFETALRATVPSTMATGRRRGRRTSAP